MKVIAISGSAASGKDSVALMLKEQLEGVEIFSFSSELKKIASSLWGMGDEWSDYQTKAKYRDKLITLGKSIRAVDINTWVDIVIEKIKKTQPAIAVITDLRFLNELSRLALAFTDQLHLLRVCAPIDTRLSRMDKDRAQEYIEKKFYKDQSETEFDFIESVLTDQPNHIKGFMKFIELECHCMYNDQQGLDLLKEKVVSYTKLMKPISKPYRVAKSALEIETLKG